MHPHCASNVDVKCCSSLMLHFMYMLCFADLAQAMQQAVDAVGVAHAESGNSRAGLGTVHPAGSVIL